jgi:ABC-type phosphate transport system substrate-binding protein
VTRRLFLTGLLVLVWTDIPSTQSPAFVIIVNKANPVKTLPIVELRRIFMKQSRMWSHAEPMVPVEWESTAEIRQVFSKQVLNRSVREMAEWWVQQSMTQGIAPPSTQRSARAILRFVASVPGAISYVSPADVDATVNIVAVK